mmetsp:Transcript_33295/g.70925  ORF Transcript_33295/g.70925 Transcript_33295/m.70925 type:complete len:404 (+) Transcript_33295:66-1277(+)
MKLNFSADPAPCPRPTDPTQPTDKSTATVPSRIFSFCSPTRKNQTPSSSPCRRRGAAETTPTPNSRFDLPILRPRPGSAIAVGSNPQMPFQPCYRGGRPSSPQPAGGNSSVSVPPPPGASLPPWLRIRTRPCTLSRNSPSRQRRRTPLWLSTPRRPNRPWRPAGQRPSRVFASETAAPTPSTASTLRSLEGAHPGTGRAHQFRRHFRSPLPLAKAVPGLRSRPPSRTSPRPRRRGGIRAGRSPSPFVALSSRPSSCLCSSWKGRRSRPTVLRVICAAPRRQARSPRRKSPFLATAVVADAATVADSAARVPAGAISPTRTPRPRRGCGSSSGETRSRGGGTPRRQRPVPPALLPPRLGHLPRQRRCRPAHHCRKEARQRGRPTYRTSYTCLPPPPYTGSTPGP